MDNDTAKSFLEELKNRIRSGTAINQWICDELKNRFPDYNWVGIYLLADGKLHLDTYAGEKTEHEVITLGEGLCSLAVVRDQIVNEPDVKGNNTYLACFPSTNSEIVVPIRVNGTVIGEIDIDSDKKDAFSKSDETFLDEVAGIISKVIRN